MLLNINFISQAIYSPLSQLAHGDLYCKKGDYVKALEWYEKAATLDLAEAQLNLGLMYLHGLGVPQSNDKAIEYFTQAAQQGDNDAKSELQKLSQQDK